MLNISDIKWPKYEENILKEENINVVVQINGKKRGLLKTKSNISEEDLLNIINKDVTLRKYLEEKEIRKKIYIKDKLINLIV